MHAPYRGHRIVSTDRSAAEIMASAVLDYNFAAGTYRQTGVPACTSAATCLTVTRTGAATNLLPTSPSGAAYTTYAANTARVTPGSGLLVEPGRTNRLFNSAVPATQTRSMTIDTFTLWVNGPGSITMSPGTATGCGTGVATQGNPVFFNITVSGTCTFTLAGSLNAIQAENGPYPTSFIVSGGATEPRSVEQVTVTSPPVIGTSYSMMCRGIPFMPTAAASNQTLASLSDGTTTNFVYCRRSSTDNMVLIGSTGWSIVDTDTTAVSGLGKVAGAMSPTEQVAAFGSGFSSAAAAAGPPGLNTIKMGAQGNNLVPFDGYVSGFAFWPVALSTADLLKVVQ